MFPRWEPRPLDEVVPSFDSDAKDLLLVKIISIKKKKQFFGLVNLMLYVLTETFDL